MAITEVTTKDQSISAATAIINRAKKCQSPRAVFKHSETQIADIDIESKNYQKLLKDSTPSMIGVYDGVCPVESLVEDIDDSIK